MGLTAVPHQATHGSPAGARVRNAETLDWISIVSGGSLLAAGLLMLSGKRRAAMAAAAVGTSLAMLEQQELLGPLWKQLPGYVDQVQQAIDQVRNAVEEITVKTSSGPRTATPSNEG